MKQDGKKSDGRERIRRITAALYIGFAGIGGFVMLALSLQMVLDGSSSKSGSLSGIPESMTVMGLVIVVVAATSMARLLTRKKQSEGVLEKVMASLEPQERKDAFVVRSFGEGYGGRSATGLIVGMGNYGTVTYQVIIPGKDGIKVIAIDGDLVGERVHEKGSIIEIVKYASELNIRIDKNSEEEDIEEICITSDTEGFQRLETLLAKHYGDKITGA